MEIYVGTCGFPLQRRKIYATLDVVELQDTFYNMPTSEKMEKLRKEAPPQFRFTAKVFQGLTHPAGSPTYKKTKNFKPTEKHGRLQPTRENFELWEQFIENIKPLTPDILVIQTPPSLEPSPHIYQFFTAVVDKWKLAWEPRGKTLADPKLLEKIADLGVIIVIDPLKKKPERGPPHYFRLHGLGDREVNYSYKYTDKDIRQLAQILISTRGPTYVMFNNIYMYQDATALKELLKQQKAQSR